MDVTDFTNGAPGQVLKTAKDYWAFVPSPLPPLLDLSRDLIRQNSEADRALGELAGVAHNLPNPHLLINPFMRREAVLSSRIEGTQASLSDLFHFEATGTGREQPPDVRELANYVSALEYGLRRLEELPVCLRLIREMHERLMEGIHRAPLTPGEFRRSQNWIGPPGCLLTNAVFVPPPVEEMTQCLRALEDYLRAPSDLPPLARLGLIHYQFEAIHPFLDGNGRIGRLLITLLLCSEGLLPQPLLYLSAFFERHRDEYYRLLLDVSRHGRWSEWLLFFLRGVAEQSRDAAKRSARLLDLWERYRQRLQVTRSSALLLRLVDQLLSSPVITVSGCAKALGVPYPTAAYNIRRLLREGILREGTGRRRNRVFIGTEILGILEATETEGGTHE